MVYESRVNENTQCRGNCFLGFSTGAAIFFACLSILGTDLVSTNESNVHFETLDVPENHDAVATIEEPTHATAGSSQFHDERAVNVEVRRSKQQIFVNSTTRQFPADEQSVENLFRHLEPLFRCRTWRSLFERFVAEKNSTPAHPDRKVVKQAIREKLVKSELLKRESQLLQYNQSLFHRLQDFDMLLADTNNSTLGGVGLMQDALILFSSIPKDFIVLTCDFIYWAGGCGLKAAIKNGVASKETGLLRDQELTLKLVARKLSIVDTGVFVAQYWGEAFYHHLIENMPKLAMVHNYILANPNARVIIPAPTTFILQLYDLLGINQTQLLPLTKKTPYFVKRLLVPTATRCGVANPTEVLYLQNAFNARIPIVYASTIGKLKSDLGDKRLIVFQSRKGLERREITNHNDILQSLRKAFAKCCFVVEHQQSAPFEDTIVMHHMADLIVGPHGAGLSLLTLSRPGTALLEFHPKSVPADGGDTNLCHQRTAHGLLSPSIMIKSDNGDSMTPFTVNVSVAIAAARTLLFNMSIDL